MPDAAVPPLRFLAPAQVAELLAIEVEEVIALVTQGELRGTQLGSPARWRIEEASVTDYIADQTELSRRMALWQQADAASFPELWGVAQVRAARR